MVFKVFMYWVAKRGEPVSVASMQEMDSTISPDDISMFTDAAAAQGFFLEFEEKYHKFYNNDEIEKLQTLLESKLAIIEEGNYYSDKTDPMKFSIVGTNANISIGISAKNQFNYYMDEIKTKNFNCLKDMADVYMNMAGFSYDKIIKILRDLWASPDVWAGSMLSIYKWPIEVYFSVAREDLTDADQKVIAMLKKPEIKYPVKLNFYNLAEPIYIDDFRM